MLSRPTTEQFSPPAYAYDVRGQKVAEWGTAVQPAAYEYDNAVALIHAAQKNKNSGMVVYCKINFIVCKKYCFGLFMNKEMDNTGYQPSELLLPGQIEQGMYSSERKANKVLKAMIQKIAG